MKIATIGTCQAKIIAWYMRQLNPEYQAKWICPEVFSDWEERSEKAKHFKDQFYNNIWNHDEGVAYLKDADCIIYQKIEPKTSPLFNYDKIESYKKRNAKTVSLTYFLHSPTDPSLIKGMMERESNLLPDIRVSDIILNHPKKNEFKFSKVGNPPGTHCNSTLFLEIIREICKILNFEFFSEEEYVLIEKQKYPFEDL